MVIEPQAFYSILGAAITAIVGALAFGFREIIRSRTYTNKARADGDLVTEKSQAGTLTTLAEIAKAGVDVQRDMVVAIRDNTRAFGENAAELRGMVAMINDHSKVLRNATISIDEVVGQFPSIKSDLHIIQEVTASLQTDIEGTINEQFAPIVIALTNIGLQLAAIVAASQSKDVEINTRLTTLITDFQSAEKRLMKVLEPIVLKHIGESHEDLVPTQTD